MCPDRQMISLYFDRELPSPWKEKLESHIESCPACRTALRGYRQIGESLRDPDKQTVEAAQNRVWKKLGEVEYNRGLSRPKLRFERARKLLGRTVTLPLPAAAAVLIVFIFFALLGIFNERQPPSQDMMAAINLELEDHGIVPIPVQDMSGVLQYLLSQDSGDFMVVRLPENSRFTRVGEPALINAADYSRRNTFR